MAKIEIYYPDYSLFLKEIIMEKKQTSFKLSGESPTADITRYSAYSFLFREKKLTVGVV